MAAGPIEWTRRIPKPFPRTIVHAGQAERAAGEQIAAGETTEISYEDNTGHWHDERAAVDDRPEVEVDG